MMESFLMSEFLKEKVNWKFEELMIDGQFKNREAELEFLNRSSKASEHSIFYPQSFRTAFLVQLFSILEYELRVICLHHHIENKTDFSINDLSGRSDLEKAKKYLTKSCSVNFENLNPEWNFLNTIRKIRNSIVHHKGEIKKTDKDWNSIFNFVKNNKDKIGFSEHIEYMNKEDYAEFIYNHQTFHLEVGRRQLNNELVNQICSFLHKLKTELNWT